MSVRASQVSLRLDFDLSPRDVLTHTENLIKNLREAERASFVDLAGRQFQVEGKQQAEKP